MDDTQRGDKNQSSQYGNLNDTPVAIEPEEVSADVENPEEIKTQSLQMPTDVPVYEQKKSKLFFIGGIAAFFLIVFGITAWLFVRSRSPNSAMPTVPQIVKKTPVTLTYWGLWDEEAVLKPVFDAYIKKNPHVTIKYQLISVEEEYRQRLLARSKTGNGPDIFRFHNTWLPEISDVLTEVPETVYPKKVYESTYYPVILKDLKIDNKYYGIPFMMDALMLFYNDDIFRKAGIVSAPTVWVGDKNDVYTIAHQLTVRDSNGTIVTSGMAMGTTSNIDHFGSIYTLLLLVNGGSLKSLDQSQASEALQFYRKFAEDGIWNDSLPMATTAFIESKVAMMIAPSWTLLSIKGKNPSLPVKTAPIPKGLNGKSVTLSTYWVEGVNRYSKNQIEAWKLLAFIAQKDQLAQINQMQTKTRPVGWIYPRKDMADLQKTDPFVGPIIAQASADEIVSLPVIHRTFDQGLNDEIIQYIRNAINESAKGVDYSNALRAANDGVSQVFGRYKIQ